MAHPVLPLRLKKLILVKTTVNDSANDSKRWSLIGRSFAAQHGNTSMLTFPTAHNNLHHVSWCPLAPEVGQCECRLAEQLLYPSDRSWLHGSCGSLVAIASLINIEPQNDQTNLGRPTPSIASNCSSQYPWNDQWYHEYHQHDHWYSLMSSFIIVIDIQHYHR